MTNEKVTTQDLKRLLYGLDPVVRKNLTNHCSGKPLEEQYDFIRHFKKIKGLDTREGMQAYQKRRTKNCGNCP